MVDVVVDDNAERLYDRLFEHVGRGGTLTYVAEKWLEQLLHPLGYHRKDQSEVACALKALAAAGLVRKESSVKSPRGYHASRRRSDYIKPRVVVIKVLR